MGAHTTNVKLSLSARYALRSILYYDIFSYPLTEEELFRSLRSDRISQEELKAIVDDLVDQNMVFSFGQFICLHPEKELVQRRLKGNRLAEKRLPLARRISRLISLFPFVRGIGISGSMSKNYMDEKSDIDFFIITTPGRLWVARTLLVLFKKVFLFNSFRYFCVNYLISEDNLEIEDKNVFTATELVTLMPMYGADIFRLFYSGNSWVYRYQPNMIQRSLDGVPPARARGLKWLAELLLSGNIGRALNYRSMQLTIRHWKRKFPEYSRAEFHHAFRSRRNVSKHHPQNFQRKVLEALAARIRDFEARHHVSLAVS